MDRARTSGSEPSLTDTDALDPEIANDIGTKAAKMVDGISLPGLQKRLREPGYCFCTQPGVSQEAILSALQLLRLDIILLTSSRLEKEILRICCESTWVYRTLESVGGHHPNLISDLWQALFLLRPIHGIPTAASLHTMLSVISAGTGGRLRKLAYPDPSVWASLGYVASITSFYARLGDKLSRELGWKEIISNDLPDWLRQFPTIIETSHPWFTDERRKKIRSVLSRVWRADETEASEFEEEATVVMVLSVLAKAWDQYFKDEIVVPLGEALVRAGEHVEKQWGNDSNIESDLKDSIVTLGDLISRLASIIPGESRTPGQQQADTVSEAEH
ncbi:hypothetical protein FB451DRAFT_1180808 [Mycena latifolia]|nr:hypothetical protein FB451DRAFT_1180808 [Mycena latifolia]